MDDLLVGMAGMACFMLAAQISVLRMNVGITANVFAVVATLPGISILSTSGWALTGLIELDHAGIRTRRFARQIPWSNIVSWRFRHNRIIEIDLADGRKRWVFGPATNIERNKVIARYLVHFGVRDDTLEVATPNTKT